MMAVCSGACLVVVAPEEIAAGCLRPAGDGLVTAVPSHAAFPRGGAGALVLGRLRTVSAR